jgi:hypothetical protein
LRDEIGYAMTFFIFEDNAIYSKELPKIYPHKLMMADALRSPRKILNSF